MLIDGNLNEEIFRMAINPRKYKRIVHNIFEKIFGWGMVLFFAISISSALLTKVSFILKFVPKQTLVDAAFLFVFISQLSSLLYNVTVIICGLPKLFKPAGLVVEGVIDDICMDAGDIRRLSRFDKNHLKHAIERIELGAKHARSRLSLLCGAVDKIGILPAIVTWGIAYYSKSDKIPGEFVYIAGLAIAFSFIMGFFGELALHRVDGILCVLKLALLNIEAKANIKENTVNLYGVTSAGELRMRRSVSGIFSKIYIFLFHKR